MNLILQRRSERWQSRTREIGRLPAQDFTSRAPATSGGGYNNIIIIIILIVIVVIV